MFIDLEVAILELSVRCQVVDDHRISRNSNWNVQDRMISPGIEWLAPG